ncbi:MULTISPECIES: DHA2 family efflux MFS transporter permease subunit [unclassified Staphylococcus]|uniref:DHA2 family efflux MFS transporter permease subunit n=1 Tax=unclassified Staphylococcus TaxID=91994 RepID=UPI00187DEBEF|nr:MULTISPECIES: DHA2 family efflux MFS transporter permease subunit [unclassified Staphylococcus]MBF2757419.1 DHA2 family efflux MFS transporter permease subunit [Staphylococcus haemolyticus]MBF2774117.1 DHA2 family efflux MFS transporter permease subunit [Staphylococcus haemolyticus]MBF2776083.1 DHA2 family efflux MFS transporter permease subunit [Staphylococcus haemolyticus]MBF2815720.1 DHA2 family efflux MFS transporter permease subunit [Staphylococcus haemolyticus]MBF9719559.1 DHA2 family
MTTTFIVGYIVLAVILVGLVNVLVLKSRKKRKNQTKGQHVNEESKSQINPSKFKISDLDRDQASERTQDAHHDDHQFRHLNTENRHIENDKRKDHFENEQDQQDHASEQIHPEQKQASHSLHYSDDATEDDKQDDDVNNQHLPKDSIYEPINPASQEGRVNERIKKQKEDFVFGKGITRNKILAAMLFGMFIAILNQTLLNVALPKINTEFNISASTGQWLMTGFMLVNGILIPISAFLFNKYSYRKLFIIALLLFTIGSLVCALSNNFPMMMGGRVLQAIGAGVLMPLGSNVIVTIFPPEKRGVAMGTMGIAMILAPAIGPTLSGYIVQNYHWNVMFYGMFFLGIAAMIFGYFWFRLYQKTTNPRADYQGIVYSTIGFGALLYGFSEAGNKGWGSTEIVIMFIIGVIFIVAFVIRELTMRAPMLNLEVLKSSTFTLTTIINMVVMMSLFGGMILLPIYLQNLRGFSALDSGLLLLPGSLVMGILGPITGKLLDTIGLKPLALFGIAVMTYGTWELTKLNMDTPYLHIMSIYVIRSFGMAFVMMPLMTAAINALPPRLISHGNAFLNTMRQLAGSIGTAILVTVMTTQTTNHVGAFADELDKTNPVIQDHVRQMAAQYGGQSEALQAILKYVNQLAYIEGINDAFWIATGLAFLAFVLSLFLKGKKGADAEHERMMHAESNKFK